MGQVVQQVFASLLSYKKWYKEVQVIMHPKQLVRTVIVAMRPRNTREKSLPYKSKELKHLREAVQSLALVTKQEQVEEVLEAKEIYQLLTMVGRRILRWLCQRSWSC